MAVLGSVGSLTVATTKALTSEPAFARFVIGRDPSARAFSTTIFEESESYTLGIDVNAVATYSRGGGRKECTSHEAPGERPARWLAMRCVALQRA